MAMTVIWTGMTALSLLCALAMGNQGELASAALDGAASAIELGISMAGVLCLWMGVMEVTSLGRRLYIAYSEYSSFTVWTTRVSNPV